ncbi:MAG: hypothetical protein U1E48_07715 [Paracoccaceae bacterium]
MNWAQILDMILSRVIRQLVNRAVDYGIRAADRFGRKPDAPPPDKADPDPARQKAMDDAAAQLNETARMLKRGRF